MKDVVRQFITAELLNGRADVELKDADNLLLSGLIDSLGMMRLVAFIEEDLQIPVPPEDVTIENFVSLDAIGAYLKGAKG